MASIWGLEFRILVLGRFWKKRRRGPVIPKMRLEMQTVYRVQHVLKLLKGSTADSPVIGSARGDCSVLLELEL